MFSPDSTTWAVQAGQEVTVQNLLFLSGVFSFSHISPAPAWALQGGSSLGNGHLHGLKWVLCLGSGRTFSSSSSSSCCSSDLTSSVSDPLCSLSPSGTFSPFSCLWLPHWVNWNCLESAVLGMEQLQPVLTETPPWHLHPVRIQRKYLNQTLPLGWFFWIWLLWWFCTCS